MRFVDVVLVVLAAPFVVIAGLPVLGYACAAAVWIVTRLVGDLVERRARASADLRTRTGLAVAGLMVRAWLVALTILAVGLAASRADGAAAAVTVLAAFTIYFVMSVILRPTDRESSAR